MGLAPAERRLLLEALRWLALARLVLWVVPFRRAERRLGERGAAAASAVRDAAAPDAIATAVRRARRLVPVATCLPQAMATRSMLVRRGIACELRIGVAKDEQGRLQAHAWVEAEGSVVIGDLPDLARFKRLPSLPGAAS